MNDRAKKVRDFEFLEAKGKGMFQNSPRWEEGLVKEAEFGYPA